MCKMIMVSEKYALLSVYDSARKTIENLKKTVFLLDYFGGSRVIIEITSL